MPVSLSHLGLTVSHLPSAASFYLSALQPLGYRFIGSQGDSIGLGIKDADFFITQGPRGATIAPTHIAFAADDRTQVRECYTSALRGGGSPNGPPGYRHNNCGCFNSAVEDLDGNTIEFIFRENGPCQTEEPAKAPSEHSRVLNWQEGVSREAQDGVPQDDTASVVSKAQSRAQTALDLASSTSKSADKPAEEAPEAGAGENSVMAALASGITPKAILGGAIGAVAAGAIAYAFYQSEQNNARDEAAYKSSIAASSERGRGISTYAPTQPQTMQPMKRSLSAAPPRTARFHRNYSTTESIAPPPPRTHRNFSVTESRVGPRPPPTQVPTQAPTAMKAIEARAFDDDSEIQAAISRHTSRRPTMARSQTFEPSVYTAPMSTATRSRGPPQRSATLADEPSVRSHLLLEGPKELVPAGNSLRSNRDDDPALQRHDSAASAFSHRSSKHSRRDDGERRPSASQAGSVKSSSKREDGERRSSASQAGSVKSSSSRKEGSRHEGSRYEGSRYEETRRGSLRDPDALSDASTIKASRRDSAAHIPLPASKAASKVSTRTAAEYRLPDSAAQSYYAPAAENPKATSRAPSQVSGMQAPPPPASRAPSHTSAAHQSPAPMDSPVPSYYAAPQEKPRSASRTPSQATAMRVPLPASRAQSHASAAPPPPSQSGRRGSQVSARQPSVASRRPSLASTAGSAVRYPAAIPLPESLVSARTHEDVDDSDGMGDIKTVVPDDSISCIDLSQPKAPRSDYSRHSERSHRSHRTQHTSRSKHPHRQSGETGREPGDAQTIVPDDSISSVGSKPARSDHSHRSHREHKPHHSSRSSRHGGKSHSHDKEKSREKDPESHEERTPEPEDQHIPLDSRTVLPEDSISSVGAPARSHYSDAKSHHSSRSKHGKSRDEDGSKSHHSSSRSKHSRSHKDEDDKEKKRSKDSSRSDAGKSDVTVKPAKSKVSVMTLPAILRGGGKEKEKEKENEKDERRSRGDKRSVASYA